MAENRKAHPARAKVAVAVLGIVAAITAVPGGACAESPGTGTIALTVPYDGPGVLRYRVWNEEQYTREMSKEETGGESEVCSPSIASGTINARAGNGVYACDIAGIRPGTYMIYVFADKNGNGILDEGICGPTEPWGMSALKKKPLLRAPRFNEVSFSVKGTESAPMEIAVK